MNDEIYIIFFGVIIATYFSSISLYVTRKNREKHILMALLSVNLLFSLVGFIIAENLNGYDTIAAYLFIFGLSCFHLTINLIIGLVRFFKIKVIT